MATDLDKQELAEVMDASMEAMFGNKQMQAMMRMQLAAQLLANSNADVVMQVMRSGEIDPTSQRTVSSALLVADELMSQAIA
jgi:hypothetical protein